MSNIRTALIKIFYSLRSRFRHLPHPLSKSWRRSRPAPFHAPPENEIIYLPNQSMTTLNVTQHTMAGCQRSIMPIHAIFYHSFPSKPHLLPGYATDSSRWYTELPCVDVKSVGRSVMFVVMYQRCYHSGEYLNV